LRDADILRLDLCQTSTRFALLGFPMSQTPHTFAIALIGPGHVGAAFLDQLLAAQPHLLRKANLDLRLCAIASSRKMLLDDSGLNGGWRAAFSASNQCRDFDRLVAHLHDMHLPHKVIVDCSASGDVAARYAGWLVAGIHVITPNKQAGAGALAQYHAIRNAAAASGALWRYEATVCAGLPVISTLRDLLDTGDELITVEGIFSGTLAWLFNQYDGRVPFSQLVAQARAMGYTEPDPRDDLCGIDVARKLTILARESGCDLSLQDVQVESLVPESLRTGSADDFMARLHEADAAFAQRLAQAQAANKVLRYVAKFSATGKASVSLVELPTEHAFAHLRLTDNIVQFTTRRYRENPLIVQGPGAGADVTAAGVFADLLRVAAGQGVRL
jgi:aspartokinase/homoserine dehydrogenase 1